jgi:putative ABC transport system ATP-binding protein
VNDVCFWSQPRKPLQYEAGRVPRVGSQFECLDASVIVQGDEVCERAPCVDPNAHREIVAPGGAAAAKFVHRGIKPYACGIIKGVIHLRGVSKEFDGKRKVVALERLNLDIARGEMVSIVGPSGSGKSTLLNLIGGLDRPSAGEIEIDGEVLSQLSDDDLTRVRRDKIGFIFQFFNLLPTLSCLQNVSLPLHLRGWPRKKIDERARELLGLVQLSHRLEHLPDELSGGERQRVAIARALSVYPPILLADEPTGNLDTATGAEILKLIHDLHERLGSTVLIVTHDSAVAASCDRAIQIRDGRIVSDVRKAETRPPSAVPEEMLPT